MANVSRLSRSSYTAITNIIKIALTEYCSLSLDKSANVSTVGALNLYIVATNSGKICSRSYSVWVCVCRIEEMSRY